MEPWPFSSDTVPSDTVPSDTGQEIWLASSPPMPHSAVTATGPHPHPHPHRPHPRCLFLFPVCLREKVKEPCQRTATTLQRWRFRSWCVPKYRLSILRRPMTFLRSFPVGDTQCFCSEGSPPRPAKAAQFERCLGLLIGCLRFPHQLCIFMPPGLGRLTLQPLANAIHQQINLSQK